MNFRLVRHLERPAFATYGTLFSDRQEQYGVTLELPYVDRDHDGRRDHNLDRIQQGRYRFIRRPSPKRKGRLVWWGCDIPDVASAYFADEPTATTCQLHSANFPWELEGCIAIGTAFGDVQYSGETVTDGPHPRAQGQLYPGITKSKAKLAQFMELTKDEQELWLDIVDAFGAPAGTWA